MSREELIEALIMIGIIVAFWPMLLLEAIPPHVRYLFYGVAGVLVVIIFIRRLGRIRAGLKYSRNMRDLQEQIKTGGQPTPLIPPDESDDDDIEHM